MKRQFMKDKETGEELEDKPRWISEDFPLHSLDSDKAKSTKRYLAIDPLQEQKGDWANLVGYPAMLTVSNSPSKKDPNIIYENVAQVSSMRAKEAKSAPELVNPPKVFDVDEPDMTIFWSLPTWLQEKIQENLEYEGSALEKLVEKGVGKSEEDTPKKDNTPSTDEDSGSDESDDEDW